MARNICSTYFVQEGDCAVLVSQIANFLDGSDTSAHGIDAFKRNDFGRFFRPLPQFVLEIDKVIVFPDDLLSARMTNPLDHRRVIGRIGEIYAAGQL